jgi:predicted RNase H-like HicB family nuclease
MYRAGLPFWKTAARFGVPVLVRVHVHLDKASNTYWAESPDLDGLTVSGTDLDELHREVLAASDELLQLAVNGHPTRTRTEMRIRDDALCAA